MFGGVSRQYWYCSGESTLKKSKFNEDVANNRASTRLYVERQDQATRQQLQPLPQWLAKPLNVLANVVRQVVKLLQKPIQLIQNFVKAMVKPMMQFANGVKTAVKAAKTAVANVLTFFFGHKKDKTKEKEERNRHDIHLKNKFGEEKVEAAEGSLMGGGK